MNQIPLNISPELKSNLDAPYFLKCGDAFKLLDSYEDGEFDLIVTSPPYNIGKIYEKDKRLTFDQYIDWLDSIIEKLCAKLNDKGAICWQVGNYVDNGETFPLDVYFYHLFKKRGLKLRNRIIWRFNFGLNATRRASGRYETLLWFTKSDEYTFNLDPIRVQQLYPGKRHGQSKGSRAGQPSGNPKGKNPGDFWEFEPETAFVKDPVWDLPNVKANHPEKTDHPCQFPFELVERCILAFSREGDKVLDPFVGTGTTVLGSLKHDRIGYGIDKSSEYIKLSRKRVRALLDGSLKLRPSGVKVRRPDTNQRVAQVPDEWKLKV